MRGKQLRKKKIFEINTLHIQTNTTMTIITIENLFFKYNKNNEFAIHLDHFSMEKSNRIFLEGPSGCGKTTFLNILTGLLTPSQGTVRILNTDITTLSAIQCDRFRADHFGIIFQLFNLIPYLSVIENIVLPCTFSKVKTKKVLTRALSLEEEASRLCHDLDITPSLRNTPVHRLSIGQQQRVAIARAMMGQPELIIADEPTSALDDDRKHHFMNLLLNECQKYNISLIFVSHDTTLTSHFNHVYSLKQLNKQYSENTVVSL